ncbi:MAG: DNA polymerase/3'-5' exonuclease PolX [Acidimicrobiia bacterium]
MPSNQEIARLLAELATLTELEDGSSNSFRARAYQNAVRAVEGLAAEATDMSAAELTKVKGIGTSTARKIREYADTGSISKLEALRAKYPVGFVELKRVPGLGPKTLALLRRELGIESLDHLRAALAAEQLRGVRGLGAKTEENLAGSIERLGLVGKEHRTPILQALPVAEQVVERLRELPEAVRVEYAGSLRRFRETIADLDVVVASPEPGPIIRRFSGLSMVSSVVARGGTKCSVLTHGGLQIDLRVVAPGQFGAALLYFTGSKAHNILLRQRALERGWTLSEYALTDVESKRVIAAETEEDVYHALGMAYIPPPLREDAGEIEAAERGELPDLMEVDDLRGDLHHHTTLSRDGHSTLGEVLEAADARGFGYLAITDHGEDLSISGVSRERMLAQRAEIAELQSEHPDLVVLHGAELNIGPDGGLDYDDDFLAGFDWCVASVHSHFRLDPARQTERIVRAMRHPAVKAIGHLTGRRIGKRPGIDLELDPILEAAAETGTALEINSNLDRLDAPADVLRQAARRGVLFVITSDAHRVWELDNLRFGVLNAQRGWVERDAVANTWDTDRFLAWIGRKA